MVIFFAPQSSILEGAMVFALVDLIQRSIDPIKNIAGKIPVIQRALTGSFGSIFLWPQERLSNESEKHLSEEQLESIEVNIPSYICKRKRRVKMLHASS